MRSSSYCFVDLVVEILVQGIRDGELSDFGSTLSSDSGRGSDISREIEKNSHSINFALHHFDSNPNLVSK